MLHLEPAALLLSNIFLLALGTPKRIVIRLNLISMIHFIPIFIELLLILPLVVHLLEYSFRNESIQDTEDRSFMHYAVFEVSFFIDDEIFQFNVSLRPIVM